MKNHRFLALGVAALALTAVAATAEPTTKLTALAGDVNILDATAMEWTTVLARTLRTPAQAGLFVGVSLEVGLYTRTLVQSTEVGKDTSNAFANVRVRVLVDGEEAHPGPVVFTEREQELSATLLNILNCETAGLGSDETLDKCELLDEDIELLVRTMAAHSFNFIVAELSSGAHSVEVQARIESGALVQAGEAEARATIGRGSVTIQQVHLSSGDDISF